MNKIEPKILKGFRDFEPSIQMKRQLILAKIRASFESFGFLPMDTPVLEYKEVLVGDYGDDEKLVFSFEDNGGREVALRYDLTVPMARFVAQNRGNLTFPFKRYQIAPAWRADKPQKGRFREFYQCDVDVVGSNEELSDVDVIACLGKTLEAIGVTNYKIRINDRAVFEDLSQDAIRIIDKVEKIGVEGMVYEMRKRNIPTKEIEFAVSIAEGKDINIPDRLKNILKMLKNYGLKGEVEFDPTIARGLDYYSGTVFETILNDKPEFGSICSGGRYDRLLEKFSDESLPAVGGSIGVDRLIDALAELGLLSDVPSAKVIVLNMEQSLLSDYLKLASELREQGVSTEIYYDNVKLDKQFKYAEKKNIEYAILIGDEEKQKGVAQLKNLKTRKQEELSQSMLIKQLIQKSE